MLNVKCEEHMQKVKEFASKMGLTEQLESQLDYLSAYGSGREDGRDYRCDLYTDFAPHSFTFSMWYKEPNGDWKYWFNGGLILQLPNMPADGSFPSLTVSLAKGSGWFVHT